MLGFQNSLSDAGVSFDHTEKTIKGSFSPSDRKSRFAEVDGELLERLDRNFAIKQLSPYPKMFSSFFRIEHPPLICGANAVALGDLTGWFGALGLPVNICKNTRDLANYMEVTFSRPSLIVVEVDSIGGFEEILDPLFEIRVSYPEILVVLISSELSGNDFSVSRLNIADICLKHPPVTFEIEDVLKIAFSNNKKWRDRNIASADAVS